MIFRVAMRAAGSATCLYNQAPVTGTPEGDAAVFENSYSVLFRYSTGHVLRIRHKKVVINNRGNVLRVRVNTVAVEGQYVLRILSVCP